MLRKVNVVQNYGNRKAMLDMIASEATDLPSINDVVEGYEVQAGSMAYIVQSDIWATLDADDKWYSGGQEVPTDSDDDDTEPAQSLNSSPQTLNLRPGANFETQLNDIQQEEEENPDEETDDEEQPEEEKEPAIKEVLPNYKESIEEPEKDVNDDEELV